MSGWPGVGSRSVRTHLLGRVFDAIDEARHDAIRQGGTCQQSGPVATAFIASQFHTDNSCRSEELQIVVDTRFEIGQQLGVLLAFLVVDAEHGLIALDGPASQEQGYAYKGHIVHKLVGFDTWGGLRLEKIEIQTLSFAIGHLCRGHITGKGVGGQMT